MKHSTRAALVLLGLGILGFDAVLLVGTITIPLDVQDVYHRSEATLAPGETLESTFYSNAPAFEANMLFQAVAPAPCNISVTCVATTRVLRFPESLDALVRLQVVPSNNWLTLVFYSGNFSDGTPNAADTNITVQVWVHGRISTDAWWLSWGGPASGYVLGAFGGLVLVVIAGSKRLQLSE